VENNLLRIDEYRNNPEFYFSKGLRCANKKNLNDAYKNILKAIELEPDNCEYKFNIACFLSEMHRPKEANRVFNDILLNFDPTMYDCYFGLGCNSFEIGDTEKAAEYFDKYLYFESAGEFSEEVAEMIFYLKLYDGISHNNRFIRRSDNSLRKAKKYLQENSMRNATRELYKSINSNPFNVNARNLLTLTLMEQQKYNLAGYISRTVRGIDDDNVWANCLCIYILLYSRKHSSVNKILEILAWTDIADRENLLCVATTLIVFNKIDELITLLEMHIIEYGDSFIYSILLLTYALTKNKEKFNEVFEVLSVLDKTNNELVGWLEYIKSYISKPNEEISAIGEYQKIFCINKEAYDTMYIPMKYQELYAKMKRTKPKLSKRDAPIIECAMQHREIMYTWYYEMEIIGILNDCKAEAEESLEANDTGVAAYSAALEFIYCKQYCIEMGKEELILKYDISSITFNKALKKMNFRLLK